ncbi:hypothetical protein BT63DRAFT_423839 [Microthyrium microscopicum]|uniref:Uncharacterized protein n=1 Tax=Microthyrium microscopicum TaxID=703497 RepID=A0A6A6UC56_9PEZI|nr:hypothetical protein BT63DRAFT_423839 [Microthyrium microscopicum]
MKFSSAIITGLLSTSAAAMPAVEATSDVLQPIDYVGLTETYATLIIRASSRNPQTRKTLRSRFLRNLHGNMQQPKLSSLQSRLCHRLLWIYTLLLSVAGNIQFIYFLKITPNISDCDINDVGPYMRQHIP